ncbi:MAG: LD-carboxypeptidase [Myxococcaceae bacterium]
MLKPLPLSPGSRVRVVAPAGPFEREAFEAGVVHLRARYDVVFDDGVFAKQRYLAGDDAHRLTGLNEALGDENCRAVFCARGGYGAMRLLSRLNLERLPLRWLVGFSDITALHACWQKAGRVSAHGPVVTQLGRASEVVREQLFSLLESTRPAAAMSGACVVPGVAEGPLIGGNLSVLTRLLGTPFAPPFEGAVLLLEDVSERPYRLDRMWTHLALAGVFQKVRGVVLGQFMGCDEPSGEYTAHDILEGLAKASGLPCAWGFPIGHADENVAVPLGVNVRLDATAGRLSFLESAVAPSQSIKTS